MGTTSINFNRTVYGGYIKPLTGELINNYNKIVLNGSEGWQEYQTTGVNQFFININGVVSSGQAIKTVCDTFKSIKISDRAGNYNTCYSGTNAICFNIDGMTIAEWKTWLASNNVTVVYEVNNPTEYQLTPIDNIHSLLGYNAIFADCGAITELKYTRDLNLCINDIIARIEALEGASNSRSLSVSPVLTKSLTSDSDKTEGILEGETEETEEETKEEAQKNER